MALSFIPSDAGLLALQAAVVAAPRPVPRPGWMERFRGRGWALVPIGSIVVVVFAIRYVSDTATGLTWLALIAVPILAAVALGWAVRGARAPAALLAVPLFLLAWLDKSSLAGEASGALLSALSCVTLGVLLAAVTPSRWLKVGIVLMAAADVWLVASDLLQSPNNVLVAAAPPAGLPQLQAEIFGTVSMGYGDLFVAALLGAVLASQWRRQWQAAVLTLVIAGCFDLLFLFINELPATVPVALALIVMEAWETASGSRRARAPLRVSGSPWGLRRARHPASLDGAAPDSSSDARPRIPRLRIRRSP